MRCHDTTYGSTEFNPEPKISQRFRPFVSRGRTVPTLYASMTLDGALSETLFHLVPVEGPDRSVRLSRFTGWAISHLEPKRELRLVDLTDDRLTDLELTRQEMIESPASVYPETARWAQAFFDCPLKPDGLIWNSRQSQGSLAAVLFARGRVTRRDDLAVKASPELMDSGRGADLVEAAAERMEVLLVR